MSPLHIALALLVTLIWGVNFVVIKVGLQDFPPLLFCALRFALAALPLLILRGPLPAPLWRIVQIGLLLGVIKFGLLFVGMHLGMPAGLSSLVLQSQVFFTLLIAALFLGERPSARALVGLLLAVGGLLLIGWQRPLGGTLLAFLLVVAAALAWAFANIATKRSGASDMLRLISWVSLIPPLPLLALSWWFEGPQAIGAALEHLSWRGVGALLYIAFLATTVGFGIWSFLLRRYPASQVTPFALAVPISGLLAGWWLLDEQLSALSWLACVLVFVGLAITVVPASLWRRRPAPADTAKAGDIREPRG
ncbi:EamA family transporter [Pseudomonas sp. UL073]|uniref:EamA family transporter n=1 Tax=Zestomonas insulae TaxID=2809017 RepID=A0ABS2IKF2_9GAMM|nr:EamA family transporter [Pseudomonas insulae]MBM7062849.1 EamA family transporter [Pseudomonas insulae]